MIPPHMLADLAIRHAAAMGELCMAMALRHADQGDDRADAGMTPCATPRLLVNEVAGCAWTGSLEAGDRSFVITFARRWADDPVEAWIVAGGVAIHSPDAGRIPFRPILCRIRTERK